MFFNFSRHEAQPSLECMINARLFTESSRPLGAPHGGDGQRSGDTHASGGILDLGVETACINMPVLASESCCHPQQASAARGLT
mmetsp:Transcript_33932/g.54000  ORF Transcript_33932/g.54000 Transcript_33932/m.54000 type:complete len:84 (+) Transcript_33932:1730-1981(+)